MITGTCLWLGLVLAGLVKFLWLHEMRRQQQLQQRQRQRQRQRQQRLEPPVVNDDEDEQPSVSVASTQQQQQKTEKSIDKTGSKQQHLLWEKWVNEERAVRLRELVEKQQQKHPQQKQTKQSVESPQYPIFNRKGIPIGKSQKDSKQQHPVCEKWENEERAANPNIDVEVTDKEIAISVVSKDRFAFQYAPEHIRSDKDVVLIAVSKNTEMLKYALNGLNQDR